MSGLDKNKQYFFLFFFFLTVYLQKWKQLSRLQRSVIVFILVLLFICGISSYPTVTDHLRGKTVFK